MVTPSTVARINPSLAVVCLMRKVPVGLVVGAFWISEIVKLIL
jgi:hypothetical protein